MRTKEQIILSRSGERVKTNGHFYGRFREFMGCRTRAVTGGSGANGLTEGQTASMTSRMSENWKSYHKDKQITEKRGATNQADPEYQVLFTEPVPDRPD